MTSKNDEITLDPEDWDSIRNLGHKILDDMLSYQQTIKSQPFKYPTDEAIDKLKVPLPDEGMGEESVYELMKEHFLPYTLKMTRPDFWGWVLGTGSTFGALVQLFSAGMNYGDEPWLIGQYVINQSLDWIKEMVDYPLDSSGVFLSGGSEANFTGLAVARYKMAEIDVKSMGIQQVPRYMTLYCSDQAHDCLDKSIELLGFGNDALRWIPSNDEYQMDMTKLEKAIKEDREKGYHPFCVIGTAGSTNLGSFDDLNAIADLCERENLWFHLDAAFGAWVKLSPTHRHLVSGLERADSVAIDLHKWMNMEYTIACTLVRDRLAHACTFVYGHGAEYLQSGLEILEQVNPFNLNLALTRPTYGMRAYMLLRAYGRKRYQQLVQKNIEQIQYLGELIQKTPSLELVFPIISNVACFRYVDAGLSETDLIQLNRGILGKVWEVNFGMISDTTVRGMYVLRACNVNHRSREQDFDKLVDHVVKFGDELVNEYR